MGLPKPGRGGPSPGRKPSYATGLLPRLGGALALFLFIVTIYSVSLGNEFVYDDHNIINKQSPLTSLSDVARVFAEPHDPILPYYRPVARMTFLLQKTMHGDNPGPFHLLNAILMGLTALALYALLRLPVFGVPRTPALLAAALYAVHPIASSCVYPIASGRETILPGLFTIATVYAFLRSGWKWHLAAVSMLALALFSKEQSVVVIVLLVLADLLKLSADSPGRSIAGWVRRYGGIVAVYAVYLLVRLSLFSGRELNLNSFTDLTIPLLSPVYALQSIVAPFFALVYEPMSVDTWLQWPRLVLAGLAVILLAILTARHWPARRRTTWFWLGWFICTMLPTANIVAQDVFFEERYVFLPMVAVIGIAGGLAGCVWTRERAKRILVGAGLILVSICAVFTINRARYFRNDLVFTRQWLATSPEYHLPHHVMGILLYQQGRPEEAARHYQKAIEIKPDWPDSHLNLGLILAEQGDYERAKRLLANYVMMKPDSAKAHYDMGVVLTMSGEFARAIEEYDRALSLNPAFAEAYHNLGCIFQHQGELERAAQCYRSALQIYPDKANSRENLEYVLGVLEAM